MIQSVDQYVNGKGLSDNKMLAVSILRSHFETMYDVIIIIIIEHQQPSCSVYGIKVTPPHQQFADEIMERAIFDDDDNDNDNIDDDDDDDDNNDDNDDNNDDDDDDDDVDDDDDDDDDDIDDDDDVDDDDDDDDQC